MADRQGLAALKPLRDTGTNQVVLNAGPARGSVILVFVAGDCRA